MYTYFKIYELDHFHVITTSLIVFHFNKNDFQFTYGKPVVIYLR